MASGNIDSQMDLDQTAKTKIAISGVIKMRMCHKVYWSKVLTDQQGLCRFFRKHKVVKNLKKSDNKTGDYSSFKFTKVIFCFVFFFQKKSFCNFLVKKWKVP